MLHNKLHQLHRLSACLLGAYIALHLLNHLLALQGIDTHIRFMEALRHVYRERAVEILLLGCCAFQVMSGMRFLYARRGQRQGFYDRLQALSGVYLAFFLLVHVSAVLFGRMQLGLDTNFYYAAAGMHVTPFQFFFVPYYFLAVCAIFAHLACAFRWLMRERLAFNILERGARTVLVIGIVTAAIIVATFCGAFYPVDIPATYRATYTH